MKLTIFCSTLLFLNLVGMNPQGKIVFLKGASSVGKSSICKEIEKHVNWKVIDEDDYHIKFTLSSVKQEFPLEYARIKKAIDDANLFHALQRRELLFKASATQEEKQDAYNAVAYIKDTIAHKEQFAHFQEKADIIARKEILADIFESAHSGKNILIDSWLLQSDDISLCKQHFTTLLVLAYASLPTLLHRLKHRNSLAITTGNLKNKRFFLQTLNSFRDNYILSATKTNNFLDVLPKETLINCLSEIRSQLTVQHIPPANFAAREITIEELDSYKMKLLSLFESDEIFISYDPHYDMTINIDEKKDPDLYAEQIMKKVESRQ